MLMNSKSNVEFDAAAVTLLAPVGSVLNVGADRDLNSPVALNKIQGAVWDNENGELALGMFCVNVHLSANNSVDGDELYQFTLEGHDSVDFSSARHPLVTMTLTAAAEAGVIYRMAIDAATAARCMIGLSHVALSVTKTGTLPSVTYRAWMSYVRAS